MSYDPRSATGIPTEPVGSLPRASSLQRLYAQYDAGQASREDLLAAQDAAAKDSIERGEATGAAIVSDGERRASPPTPSPTPWPAPAWPKTWRATTASFSRSSLTDTTGSCRG